MQKKNWKQSILFSILIILVAQVNLEIFGSNFRVSLGILMLPILVFLYHKYDLITVALLAGAGVFLSRVLLDTLRNGFTANVFWNESPEISAYYTYGFLCFLYFRRNHYVLTEKSCYWVLLAADYIANMVELLLRYRMNTVILELHLDILLVAVVRTLILWTVITGLSQYRFLLIRSDHAYRYQRLILLISKLNSEIIWMHKNTAMIESAMAKSYGLYSRLKSEDVDPALSQTALTVAKDIHEIKKEYQMILKGISEALELNLHDGEMSLSDIMRVLQNSVTALAKEQGKQLNLQIDWDMNFKTDKHYFLLSVFRNLFTNAIEANPGETVDLFFAAMQSEDHYLFTVTDNGPGISPDNINKIFTPGFSTKINFHTGEVSRGLGLSLVEDIVKIQLRGSIRLESRPGNTTFYITVPKAQLEV